MSIYPNLADAVQSFSLPGSTQVFDSSDAGRPVSDGLADVTMRGVTLAFLLDLVERKVVDESWTIQQVVDNHVVPYTKTSTSAPPRCTLFETVPPAFTGKPRFFISHTWSRKFVSLLAMLKEHFQVTSSKDDAATVLVWLDIVAINQHPYDGLLGKGNLQEEDIKNLEKVLAATEKTLFCLDEECVALTRIWCLYEVWKTFAAKDASKLLVLTAGVDFTGLKQVFNSFDALQAKASNDGDRVTILADIEKGYTVQKMNLDLRRALVESAQFEAKHTTATGPALYKLLDKAANMLAINSEDEKAVSIFETALAGREDAVGPMHVDTLNSLNNLGLCLGHLGQHPRALTLFRRAYDGFDATLGPLNLQTINTLNNCALSLCNQGRLEEALPLHRKAVGASEEALGPDHFTTVGSLNNMANCLKNLGQTTEALPLFIKAVSGAKLSLGVHHPSTLTLTSNLANCYFLMNRQDEALAMYREVCDTTTAMLGEVHASTLTQLNNLGNCLSNMSRAPEALEFFRKPSERSVLSLGDSNPTTLTYMFDLANCLCKGQDMDKDFAAYCLLQEEGAALHRQVYGRRVEVLGPDHADSKLSSIQVRLNGDWGCCYACFRCWCCCFLPFCCGRF